MKQDKETYYFGHFIGYALVIEMLLRVVFIPYIDALIIVSIFGSLSATLIMWFIQSYLGKWDNE